MKDDRNEPAVFSGRNASIEIRRAAPAVLVVKINGRDVGEHGDAPLRALDAELARGSFALFIDARESKGASLEVSNVWASWLRKHRDELDRIHMLTGSKFIQLTADFVRRFAELGDAMLIYTDAAAFEERLAERLTRDE